MRGFNGHSERESASAIDEPLKVKNLNSYPFADGYEFRFFEEVYEFRFFAFVALRL
jgi:hypothetical protein